MPGTQEPPTVISFGPFEADFSSQELRKQGIQLRLPRQSFQILKMLLERHSGVVTRDELRAALWPSDTFVDFDHSLNTAVKRLRDTLGDSADDPHFIETLPRVGYRFITREPTAVAKTTQMPSARVHAAKWSFLALGALVVTGVILFLANANNIRSKVFGSRTADLQIRALAVLPLANLSGDPGQNYFADALTEALITELSRLSSPKVISRTSAMQYRGETKKSISQIGRELHVDAILEGSVLRSGNRVRIVAHLVYVPTEQSLFTETYDRNLGDVLILQREVAQSIARQVRINLTPEQQARFQQTRRVRSEAVDAYMRAMQYNWMTLNGFARAQADLREAIQKDPGFPDAYVALAMTYTEMLDARRLSPQDAYPPAKDAIETALKLDGANCEGHFVLAILKWRHEWDWLGADREFGYALELCPNSEAIHWMHACYLAWSSRDAEGLAELDQTRQLDPLMTQTRFLQAEGLIYYHLRDYRMMIETGKEYVAAIESIWVAHFLLGVGYEGSGQIEDAIVEYQKAVRLAEGNQDPAAALGHAYGAAGRRSEAVAMLREWKRQSNASYVSPYMIATVYAGIGEKDKAFEYLEKAYQERSSDLPYFLRADLRVDSLRSDPRFQHLMRRMNFPK